MSTDTTLAPCPFCGGEPSIVERPDNIDGTEFFYALACYCGGYSARAHQMAVRKTPEQAKADAIAAWNRRTPSQPNAWLINVGGWQDVTTDKDRARLARACGHTVTDLIKP